MSKPLSMLLVAAALTAWSGIASAQTDAKDQDSAKEGEETAGAATKKRTLRKKPLADRIKSVQRKVFLKKKRVEIYPYFGMDINDPFFQHYVVGASVGFHLVDSLAFEARGGVAIGRTEQAAIRIIRVTEGAICDEGCPEFKYHADLDLTWSPVYGKISLFGEGILHFDTYLTAGPGVFGTDSGANPAFNVGIGQRYYLTDWLVARVEIRNYVFAESRADVSDIQNLMILGFSVSGFFPTSFEYEFR